MVASTAKMSRPRPAPACGASPFILATKSATSRSLGAGAGDAAASRGAGALDFVGVGSRPVITSPCGQDGPSPDGSQWALDSGAPARPILDEKRDVASRRGHVGRAHPLGREPDEVVWAARLGAGAGEAFAAERVEPRHSPDLVAVDVEITDARALGDEISHRPDAAMQPERQPIAGRIDRRDHPVDMPALEAHEVQNGAKHLARKLLHAFEL